MVKEQRITKKYAVYNADCMAVMKELADKSVDLSIYSPPFGGLYQYSSSELDLSNCRNKDEFFEHYEFIVDEIARLTKPGRIAAVHCMDIPNGNSGCDSMMDFPGDIIRLHQKGGWDYVGRYHVWKEPLRVRNKTMIKGLTHKTIVEDSSRCTVATADYLLVFRNKGKNETPIEHPNGFLEYAGERKIPGHAMQFKNYQGPQIENKYSHWIWQQYASAFWDDVRANRLLPYKEARDGEDEKHIHPLQLDIIDRILILWSNAGETVFTPFMGIGSEIYCAVRNGRKGIGAELKTSYYNQAVKNLDAAEKEAKIEELEFPDEESA